MRKRIVIKFNDNKECIKVYGSVTDAAIDVIGQASHITECCNTVPHRLTHKGYKWRYFE